MNGLHFLIVEDQTILRQFLAAYLHDHFADCKISEAGSLEELRKLDSTKLAPVSLAIVDLELPDGNALDWAEAYAARPNEPKIMILSGISEDFILFRALRSMINGFVHKSDPKETLLMGIESIMAGNIFFSPTVQSLRKAMNMDPVFFDKILSEKEQRVLKLIGEGHTNEEMAEIDGCKVSTIVDHRKNIMNKLNIHSAPELMRYALEKGFARI